MAQVGNAICRPVSVIKRRWFNTSAEMSSWARLLNSDKFKSLLFYHLKAVQTKVNGFWMLYHTAVFQQG